MATCGSQMPGRQIFDKKEMHSKWTVRSIFPVRALMLMLSLFFLLAGCTPKVRFGSPPKVNHLDTLNPGISNTADVLLALGEPRGHGTARFSATLTPRDIWLYEYTETDGKRVDLKMLLVFFEKGFYDGYLWFSSAQLIETTE